MNTKRNTYLAIASVLLLLLYIVASTITGTLTTKEDVSNAFIDDYRFFANAEWFDVNVFSTDGCTALDEPSEVEDCSWGLLQLQETYPEHFSAETDQRTDYAIIWTLVEGYSLNLEWALDYQWDFQRGSGGVRKVYQKDSHKAETWNGRLGYEQPLMAQPDGPSYSFIAKPPSEDIDDGGVLYTLWCDDYEGQQYKETGFLDWDTVRFPPCTEFVQAAVLAEQ